MKSNILLANSELHRVFGNGGDLKLAFSPLRICPLGAHVDHQLGRVSGFALNEGVALVFRKRDDNRVLLWSADFKEQVECSLLAIPESKSGHWSDYFYGAVAALLQDYKLPFGFEGSVAGSLPSGGLGSSAAVGVAYLLALESANNLSISPPENARLNMYAENIFLGLDNGILDQSMTLLGEEGALISLDCKTERSEAIRLPVGVKNPKLVVAYSGVKQALTNTNFNDRVQQCRSAAAHLLEFDGQSVPARASLGDAGDTLFESYGERLSAVERKRASHFFSECARVDSGVELWRAGELQGFGELMRESARSSIVHFESGCPELEFLVDILNSTEGVLGARFSGGGFRGSSLALYNGDDTEGFKKKVLTRYLERFPEYDGVANIFICEIGRGAYVGEIEEESFQQIAEGETL